MRKGGNFEVYFSEKKKEEKTTTTENNFQSPIIKVIPWVSSIADEKF